MHGVKFFVYIALVSLTEIGLGDTEDYVSDTVSELGLGENLIIDTDAGSDDGVAIFNILGAEELFHKMRIYSITTVNGNTNVENVAKNVLKVLKTAERLDIPVYQGSNRSILVTPNIDNYYGKDGFGDFYFPNPPPISLIKEKHGVMALVDSVNSHPGKLTLLCLGPLTNIALAIKLDDQFINKVKDIYVLGGSDSGVGNIRPGIEFNFHVDPEAAFIVLSETARKNKIVNLLTWETSSIRSVIPMKWRKEVLGTVKSPFVDLINKAESNTLVGEEWISADTLLSSVVIDDSIVKYSDVYHATVETCGRNSAGGLYVDYAQQTNTSKNIRLIKEIDTEKFKKMLLQNLNPKGGEKNGASHL